jgi:Leucine Rich repeat
MNQSNRVAATATTTTTTITSKYMTKGPPLSLLMAAQLQYPLTQQLIVFIKHFLIPLLTRTIAKLTMAAELGKSSSSVPEDILAITFSERHAATLNIDGQLMDSATIASVLREAKNRDMVKELLLRNVQVDDLVAEGMEDLFQNGTGKTWTKTEAIHCSGLISRMIRALLPYTSHFGFTGNVPIAHNPRYGLDEECLEALGNQLRLQGNDMDTISTATSAETSGKTPLVTLSIKGTRLANPGFGCFCEGIRSSTSLSTLQLSCCALEADDVSLLASAVSENQHLKSLSLADCRFGSVHPPNASTPLSDDASSDGSSASASSVPDVVEGETITQSTNNTNPQSHFPILLEALVQHPTLEVLNIFGMCCNDLSMQALGRMLMFPQSKLWHLGLKNNLSHPEDKLDVGALLQALNQNKELTYLKISGANLNDDDITELGNILADNNSTLRALSITDNAFGDAGLVAFSNRLADMPGLRYLDVQRNPITSVSKKAIVAALENNVEIERLDLDGTLDNKKAWFLCLNRAGRRLLSRSDSVSASLWPIILERASKLNFGRNQGSINYDVMYYMLRRLPWLLEYATMSKNSEIEREEEDNRKRLYHTIAMPGYGYANGTSEDGDLKPRAKRKIGLRQRRS